MRSKAAPVGAAQWLPAAALAPLLAAGIALAVPLPADAAAPIAAAPAATTDDAAARRVQPAGARPLVALVLSGGGARGLAHVGVLKALAQLNVPVDIVVGTSMGAVVGGAFVAGHPLDTLESLARQTDWDRLFSTVGDRRALDYRRRADDQTLLAAPALRVGRDGVSTAPAALGSFELELLLQRAAAPVRGVDDLDRLPLRFRSVAADLVTGELVALRHASLFTAMRASMAVPGAFAPIRVDGRLLVDGGIVRNLPVDVARALGADIVIAVNVGAPPADESELKSPLDIALQMVTLMIDQNVRASVAQLAARDVLVEPDLKGLGSTDFQRVDRLLDAGAAAVLRQRAALAPLALSPVQYAQWDARRRAEGEPRATTELAEVAFEGLQRTDARGLGTRLPFAAGETIDGAQLEGGVRRLYASGDFDRIDYELVPLGDGRQRLLLRPQERTGGLDTLRFGWQLESDFNDVNRFNVTAGYLRPWINAYGGEWRTLLQVGSERRLETELYQPIGRAGWVFVATGLTHVGTDSDVFGPERRRVARFGVQATSVEGALGARLGTVGEARLTLSRLRARGEVLVSESLSGSRVDYLTLARASIDVDTLDSVSFPRDGYTLVAAYTRPVGQQAGISDQDQIELRSLAPFSVGRHTLLLGAEHARLRNAGDGGFTLGGFLNLSGTPPGAETGTRYTLLRAIYFYRAAELPRGLGGGVYAGGSVELGRLSNPGEGLLPQRFKRAGSLIFGFDTLLGPLYLAAGRTQGGDSAVYLFVGRL
jgi:NTE family protein